MPLYILRTKIIPLLMTPAPPPSQTTLNTTLNAGRPQAGRRRGLRHRVYDSDDERDDDSPLVPAGPFRLVSRPIPESVKPCLRPRHIGIGTASFRDRLGEGADDDEAVSRPRSASTTGKTVRLVEPESKATLLALRELWSGEGGKPGRGGIAGYRRTREIYTKGQGGTAVIKGPPAPIIPPIVVFGDSDPPSPAQPLLASTSESDSETDATAPDQPPPKRPLRSPAHPPHQTPARSSSLTRPRSRSSSSSPRSASPLSSQRPRSASPALRPSTPPSTASSLATTLTNGTTNGHPKSLARSLSPLARPAHLPAPATPKWIKSKQSPPSPLDQRQHVEGEESDGDDSSEFEDMSEGALTPQLKPEQDEDDEAWGWGKEPVAEDASPPVTPRIFNAGRTPKRPQSMPMFGPGSGMEGPVSVVLSV